MLKNQEFNEEQVELIRDVFRELNADWVYVDKRGKVTHDANKMVAIYYYISSTRMKLLWERLGIPLIN